MKRIFAILSIILVSAFVAKADERPIELKQMPKNAQQFVAQHFASVPVMYATVDREPLDTDYELRLEDGTKINFDGSGRWTSVSNKRAGVSPKLLPGTITSYVTKNYPQAHYIKIERDSKSYEVKLSNGIELEFSLAGKLIGFED